MYLCRTAWQRISALSRPCITHRAILHRDVVPRRLMSSVPGGTGENIVYALLCGGAFAASVAYAYRTVTRDSARYSDRVSEIAARPKNEWKPKPWPPKSAEEAEEAAEDPEEVAEAVVETESEAAVEAAEPIVLAAEVKAEASSVVEKVTEVIVEAAETVAEVAGVVEATAEEVASVTHIVEEIAEEVEALAKELGTTALPAVEEADAETNEAKDSTVKVESVPASQVVEEVLAEEFTVAPQVVEEVPISPVDEDPAVTVVKEKPVSPVDDPTVTVAQEVPIAEDKVPSDVFATDSTTDSPVIDVKASEAPVGVEAETGSLEMVAESPVEDVAASKLAEESHLVAETATPVETAQSPVSVVEPAPETKLEYVVVVLEGAPNAAKKPVSNDEQPSAQVAEVAA